MDGSTAGGGAVMLRTAETCRMVAADIEGGEVYLVFWGPRSSSIDLEMN